MNVLFEKLTAMCAVPMLLTIGNVWKLTLTIGASYSHFGAFFDFLIILQ
jgi:hypothetical protein